MVERSGSSNVEANVWDTGVEFREISERDRKIVDSFVKTIVSD